MDITTDIINDENNETISEYIRKLRLNKGVTQYKAAQGINISRAALKRLEDGNYMPRRRTLIAMSEYYGTPLNVLQEKTKICRDKKRREKKN